MSQATHHPQTLASDRANGDPCAPTYVRALGPRLLATVRQAELDRRIADGADTSDDRELAVRAWQIPRAHARPRLASALDTILLDAERSTPARRWSVRVCRQEVEVARGEIQRLAERLRDPRPVRPCGVALTRRVLSDGTGPLYATSANDELYRQLHRALSALD
ncbi:MAG: hypothetical protein ACLP8S_16825 [Solirubrobacteraceae bacterium]